MQLELYLEAINKNNRISLIILYETQSHGFVIYNFQFINAR